MTVYLGRIFDVFSSRPHNDQEISHKERTHKAHDHGVLSEGPEQLSGAGRVHEVGRDEEGAPEEGEVVAEALGD